MSIITNNNRIPDPIFRAIKKGWYSGANAEHFASVTGLLKPPKIFVLEERYQNVITEEASDLVWSLMGSAMHSVLEKAECENSINEERLYTTIKGQVISGAIDLYENRVISDYKFTSVWTYIYKSRMKEWTQQLNIYGYLYRQAGFAVDKLQIIAIFRDWSKSKYKLDRNYPQQIVTIPIALWSDNMVESFIAERISAFESALLLADDDIPPCSPEDRWQSIRWAVMREGAQRATKLFDGKEEAEAFVEASKRQDMYVEIRESEPTRCMEYCRCNNFCNFYRGLQNVEKVA